MRIAMLSNFIMDVKNWVYNWDQLTFGIIIAIISCLMALSLVVFVKAIFDEKQKFKVLQFIFFALLTAMLVLILIIRL